jgi:hypothetical protein
MTELSSTTIGAAVANENKQYSLREMLGFIYDSNALWNNYIQKF